MKKYNVFKVIGIVIALSIILSFFIPQTQVNYGAVAKGALNPTGLVNTLSNSITSFNVFISPFIFILIISILYGVLNKTNNYEEAINRFARLFENNKGVFVVISVLVFGFITSIIGDIFPLLILVPFAITVALKLGYEKKAAIASTIGAILIGNSGSFYTSIADQMLSTDPKTNLIYKVIITAIGLVSLIVFLLIFNKPSKSEKIKVTESKKFLPIIISLILILVFIIVGMTPWSKYFKFTFFEDTFKSMTEFTVGKKNPISLFNAFIGSNLSAWGNWQMFDIFVLLAVFIVILVFIYKIKFDDFLEVCAKSIKKALPYAFIIVLANVVLVNTYSSGWFNTIINGLAGTKFNLYKGALTTALSAIVFPDYSYGLQFTVSTIMYSITKNTNYYGLLAMCFQSIYSLFLLISPTSVILLIGLYHLNIKFVDWIKYIWKYFVLLLASILTILFIVGYGVNITIIFALIVILVISILLIVKRINNIQTEIVKNNKEEKKNDKKTNTKIK